MWLRDALGEVFSGERFAEAFPADGRPAISPGALAAVSVLQYADNLSDRQAAEAVRARMDWKYLLGLELTDPGIDHSVLSDFRARLAEHGLEEKIFEAVLEAAAARGLLRPRGRQRTDSTKVLADVRLLNRMEFVGEVLRTALEALAAAHPSWLGGGAGWAGGAVAAPLRGADRLLARTTARCRSRAMAEAGGRGRLLPAGEDRGCEGAGMAAPDLRPGGAAPLRG
ncbi:transposase [Nonomuraea jabiensis]|uniref:Transposase n=1 Tax=Nonomuraea jabiensis TaxID=882448 RepID=A0A7W9GI75_9ACTN|nr:transposase [Nonomuraea jabiensis]